MLCRFISNAVQPVSFQHRSKSLLDRIAASLRIAEKHLRVLLVEHRVRDIGVASTCSALHHEDLLTLPNVEYLCIYVSLWRLKI